jgi:hypothetical protein
MVTAIRSERFTVRRDEPFVVFLIGARVNQWWRVDRWRPVVRAFNEMMNVLYRHPEKGFLGAEAFFRFSPLATISVQYWRSFEDLEHFARAKDEPHAAAWRDFYRLGGADGVVGIWHETYMIEPQHYESVYVNMPLFGLANTNAPIVPVQRGMVQHQARGRLRGVTTPVPPELVVEE